MQRVHGVAVSANTIERIGLDVGQDLLAAEQQQWQDVLAGEVPVPDVAIVEFDGDRIRTRQENCGPGVHLAGKGWNETKQAIFVSAASETSDTDPQPEPPPCFFDAQHVAKLAEKAKTKEKQGANDDLSDEDDADGDDEPSPRGKPTRAPHKPRRVLRTVVASMKGSREFARQMAREAARWRFGESPAKRSSPTAWPVHPPPPPQYHQPSRLTYNP